MNETTPDPLVELLRQAEANAPARCSLYRGLAQQPPERRRAIIRAIEGKAQPEAIVAALRLFEIKTTVSRINRHRYNGCTSCELPGRNQRWGSRS